MLYNLLELTKQLVLTMVHIQILLIMDQYEDIHQMPPKVYIWHIFLVAVSVGDVSNSSNQYFMCDGAISKTIFNKPVDVLGDVSTNGDLTMASGKKVEVNQVQSVSGNTFLFQNSPSGNVQFGDTSKLTINNAEMYLDTNDLIIRNSNTSISINLVVGSSTTYADNKNILNSGEVIANYEAIGLLTAI